MLDNQHLFAKEVKKRGFSLNQKGIEIFKIVVVLGHTYWNSIYYILCLQNYNLFCIPVKLK